MKKNVKKRRAEKIEIFELLKKDHRSVESIFSEIEDTTDRAAKKREKLYAQLRSSLVLHTKLEEEIIYPRLLEKDKTQDIGNEAFVEHDVAKYLLEKIDALKPEQEEWMATVTVLKEVIEHHVEEEEEELFPKMKSVFSREELDEMAQHFTEEKERNAGPGEFAEAA